MQHMRCIVLGKVQGVFLRAYIKECADERNITGFVRNNTDGSVELVAQGNTYALDGLVSDIRKGNTLAEIESVNTVWEVSNASFEHFTILHNT